MSRLKALENQLQAKYGSRLSNREAMVELGLNHGRELGAILYTNKLPSLRVEDIARYLAPQQLTFKEKLQNKYFGNKLTLDEMAFELSLSNREAEALLKMFLMPSCTVEFVFLFLEKHEEFYEKLTKRKYLKLMYWEYKLSFHEIGNMLGITHNVVLGMIRTHNLTKKANNIKVKGKLGYVMSEEEKEKHRMQPHSKPVLQICPVTFKTVGEFSSTGAVERHGFCREDVRKAVATAGLHKMFLWANKGEKDVLLERVKQRGDLDKKLRIASFKRPTKKELTKLYIEEQRSLKECAKIFKCHEGTMARIAREYGLQKYKSLSKQRLHQLYVEKRMSAREIAELLGYKKSTIATYISRHGLRREGK